MKRPAESKLGGLRAARIPRGRWLNAILGVVLVAVIAAAYFTVNSSGKTATVAARTATVTQGSLTATVTGSGNLASSRTSSLAFGASGKVTSVHATVGDKVKKGDVLARIDTASAERTLASAKASLASAQASYDVLVAGQTALQIESAQLSVTSASKSVSSAKSQLSDDEKAKAPKASISKDKDAITQAEQQLASAKVQLAQQQVTAATNAAGPTAAQVAQDKVSIQDAQASVDDARDALDETKLTAPFSGTILTVNGEEGDSVSAGTSSSSGSSTGSTSSGTSTSTGTGSGSSGTGSGSSGTSTGSGSSSGTASASSGTGTGSSSSSSSSSSSTFITMASLSSLDVTANIAEADIGGVKVGQSAVVTLSASDATMDGTVSSVSPQGTSSSNVVQYPVTVTVDSPDPSARLGASVSVVITTGSADNALILPTSAITTSGTRNTVELLKNGVATLTPIQVGLKGASTTQVTSGLKAGDEVQIPTTSTSSSTGVPGFGGGGLGGATRGLGGGRG